NPFFFFISATKLQKVFDGVGVWWVEGCSPAAVSRKGWRFGQRQFGAWVALSGGQARASVFVGSLTL
ncbi:hypothetical protein, partial [Sphingomonas sp. EC-HK361]|uniref:hypothetical protein n=1 Tax=Sphingomonas sp. EC-HK361 TaxID=2038397 RepID=UPI001F29BF4B